MKSTICSWLLLVACAAFAAEDYPARPIQMIVPFPAGGPADIGGRLYAQHLSAIVGEPVVILNRDGASGSIGTAAAARAAPDGYTLAANAIHGFARGFVRSFVIMSSSSARMT